MRKKIKIQTEAEYNEATEKWVQLLIQRIIIEQLDIPPRLKAKLLHNSLSNGRKEEQYYEN